ncbi:hypothetical protein [Aeromonas caviae]|uniref:hypothetical protein n=1 Tax=Aeromonas caviae TaxID=648 RepID=UPI0029D972CC|nr:hypothetical protein [Aeromonas caviae]MDX7947022.1 hypothetical protein [Aeromonas caviae]
MAGACPPPRFIFPLSRTAKEITDYLFYFSINHLKITFQQHFENEHSMKNRLRSASESIRHHGFTLGWDGSSLIQVAPM